MQRQRTCQTPTLACHHSDTHLDASADNCEPGAVARREGPAMCMPRLHTSWEPCGNVVLHAFVLPEPVIDVPGWQLAALLHHDPGIQELHQLHGWLSKHKA